MDFKKLNFRLEALEPRLLLSGHGIAKTEVIPIVHSINFPSSVGQIELNNQSFMGRMGFANEKFVACRVGYAHQR